MEEIFIQTGTYLIQEVSQWKLKKISLEEISLCKDLFQTVENVK